MIGRLEGLLARPTPSGRAHTSPTECRSESSNLSSSLVPCQHTRGEEEVVRGRTTDVDVRDP
jgi:hypothetical protein